MSSSSSAKLDFYTLTFALGFSALAAGAVHLPILAGYAALVLVSALVCVFSRGALASPLGAAGVLFALVWLGLSALCLLQALPLPLALLERIAPLNADVWSRSLRAFAEPAPDFASLSLAPGRSLVEALKAASYAVVFLVSADVSRRHGTNRVLAMVFGLGVVLAVVTALHQLFEAHALYGFYRPRTSFEIAPLLNANNRAGYLSLTFFVGLGLFLRLRGKPVRVFVAIGLCVLFAQILICRSRGGVLGLGLGLVAFLALSLALARPSDRESGRLGTVASVSAISLVATWLAVVALRRSSWQGLFTAASDKLELFASATRLIRDHAWLGVGRGALGSVFPAYQTRGTNAVYEHAENFVLQWAAEWGLPLASLALALLAYGLYTLCTRAFLRRSARRAALVGVGVLLVQNQVDLGLEVPAVSALLACVLGALFGARLEPHEQRAERAPAWLLPAGAGLVALCLALVALAPNARTPASERLALRERLQEAPHPTPPELWRALHGALQAFPADPYFPLLGGSAALADGKDALPWAARALERAPRNGSVHVLLARALWARGARTQALASLRRALELDPTQGDTALRLARRWRHGPDDTLTLGPAGEAGVPLLEQLVARAPDSRLRKRWLDEWIAHAPRDSRVRYAVAEALLDELERGPASELCRARRHDCVLELLQRLDGLEPDSTRTAMLRARLALVQGNKEEAEALLREACDAAPSDVSCGLELVELALANDRSDLDATLRSLVASACTSASSCASVHQSLAEIFAAHVEWAAALDHYQRALQEAPSPALFRAAAGAADKLGRPMQAAAFRRRAEAAQGE
jgi:tetratricopeptide (TPR) repeat protein/O-antigen ligase